MIGFNGWIEACDLDVVIAMLIASWKEVRWEGLYA